MSGDGEAGKISRDELQGLLSRWRDEAAVKRQRARNWSGNLSDEYRMSGEATGLDIAIHELQELVENDE